MTTVSASIYLLSSNGIRYEALNPLVIEEYLTARRLPTPYLGRANSFLANVDRPGMGWIILRRSEVNAIDSEATNHSLVFRAGAHSVTVQHLHVYNAVAIAGTQNSNGLDSYLVELRDKRELCRWTTLNKSYNVRSVDWVATTPTAYLLDTTDGGAAWTWATMIADIWTNISPLGGALTTTLMEVPTSDPENFVFPGVSALAALEHICSHTNNHLLLKRDGTFHIVAQSDPDAANTALMLTHSGKMLNPSSPKFYDGVRVPASVKVFFPKHNSAFQNHTDPRILTGTDQYHVDPVHSITVTTTAVVPGINVIANATATIHDSLPARYNELGTIQNNAALAAQADKRALEFIEGLRQTEPPRDDIYHYPIPFNLGSGLERIHWYDFGDGIRTEAMSSPKTSGGTESTALTPVNETPGIPDLSRWHLPFERFAVGEVYNAEIDANGSGLIRIQYGTQTNATTTTWNDTNLPHEVRAHDIYSQCYGVGDRVFIGFHRQLSRWIIIGYYSRMPKYGWATLYEPMCDDGSVTIENYQHWFGLFPCGEDEIPTTAMNYFNHRGKTGDKVFIIFSEFHQEFIIIDVEKHAYDVNIAIRRTGDCDTFCLEAEYVSSVLEVCSDELSRTVVCYPCVESSTQTSQEQSSFDQTSNTQTSTVGCGEGIINPDLLEAFTNRLAIQTGTTSETAVRQVSVTITNQTGCGDDVEVVGEWGVQNPRDNSTYQPFTGPAGHWSVLTNASGYDPDEPWSYQQGFHETYYLYCKQRYDLLTGDSINPGDPNDLEWVLEGYYGKPTLGLGSGQCDVRVSETQGGAVKIFSADWEAMPGSLQILSLNPFHAIAIFTPPSWYPYSSQNTTCGPVQVEFMEIP